VPDAGTDETDIVGVNPDYYLQSGTASCTASGLGGCVYQTDGYAWDHGDYAAEISNMASVGVRAGSALTMCRIPSSTGLAR
jgi:hypothetical protein